MRRTEGPIEAVPRRLAAAVVLVAALLALGAASAQAATPLPTLADRITGSDLRASAAAVKEVLARGGIATRDGMHVYRKAVRPAASSSVTRYEALNLAVDARDQVRGGRITLADLGDTLLRFKAFKLRGRTAPLAMRDFMTAWVVAAQKRPGRVHSFAPLMLAELARRQSPAIDLGAGTYDPATLRLSLLETELFSAAFDRFPASARHPVKPSRRRTHKATSAADAGPGNCTEVLKEYIVKVVPGYDQIESSAIQNLAGEAISVAIAKLMTGKNVTDAKAVFNANKNAVGGILSIVNTLMRLQKLAALYAGVQIYVDVPTASIEKPEAQQNYAAGQDQYGDGIFTANVGLRPDAEKAYKKEVDGLGATFRKVRKAIQDCAGIVGIPAPTFSDDVAEDFENFKVKWTLNASSKTANYEFKKTQWFAPGGRLGALTRVDPTLATHVMHVDIPTQPPWRYAPDRFYPASDTADATAELITAQPPSLGTLINGMLGPLAPFGLVDALVELSIGWFQSIDTPKDTGTLQVTEHKPRCVAGASSLAFAAQTGGACSGKYGGTFSGTADLSTGPAPLALNATFTGNVVVAPSASPTTGIPGLPAPTSTYYKVESGSLHFKIEGTTVDGCHMLAEGPVDLTADPSTASQTPLQLNTATPLTYNLRFQPPLISTVPGAFTDCPDPLHNKTITWPVATGVGELIHAPDNQPVGPDGGIAGTFAGRGDPSVPLQTWTWDLKPQ